MRSKKEKPKTQEEGEREEETTTQEERVEDKKDVNSMHEGNDVSNRHMTWWRDAWWVRMDNDPHLRVARGRRTVWRAATRAAREARETERGEVEKWEQETTGRKESNTLHVVFHFPSNGNETATATSATTTAAAAPHNNGCCCRSNAIAMRSALTVVVEKTTTGVIQLKELVTMVELLFTDIVVNGILNALVQDKSTGKPIQIIISDPDGGPFPAYLGGNSWDKASDKTGSGKKFHHNVISGADFAAPPCCVDCVVFRPRGKRSSYQVHVGQQHEGRFSRDACWWRECSRSRTVARP